MTTGLTTKRERDMQRSRVYKCDEVLLPFCRSNVTTVPLMKAYVHFVWGVREVIEAYPAIAVQGPPEVKPGRSRRRAGGNSRMISMPVWARHESIVLHELAHTVTQRVYGFRVAGHGWQYCGVYLTLVRHCMGDDAHDALLAAFRQRRVRYQPPRRKRILSPERRAELTARLTRWRAARAVSETALPLAAKPLTLFEDVLNGRR